MRKIKLLMLALALAMLLVPSGVNSAECNTETCTCRQAATDGDDCAGKCSACCGSSIGCNSCCRRNHRINTQGTSCGTLCQSLQLSELNACSGHCTTDVG